MLIYALLLVIMRLMGKRVASQLSISELAVVVTLGAAVGVPMQVQDRGMLPAVLILLVALGFQRGISLWAFRKRKVELLTQGEVVLLIADGRMLLDALRANVLSRERLFAMLRGQGIVQLGEVRRAYLEANGQLSMYRREPPGPGLLILPAFDEDGRAEAADPAIYQGFYICESCGYATRSPEQPAAGCRHCSSKCWKAPDMLGAGKK